jgi:hypothetical protein
MSEQNNQKVTWEDIVIRYAKEITRLTLENKRLMTERRKGMSEQNNQYVIQGDNIKSVIKNLREARKELKSGFPISCDMHIEYALGLLTLRRKESMTIYHCKETGEPTSEIEKGIMEDGIKCTVHGWQPTSHFVELEEEKND